MSFMTVSIKSIAENLKVPLPSIVPDGTDKENEYFCSMNLNRIQEFASAIRRGQRPNEGILWVLLWKESVTNQESRFNEAWRRFYQYVNQHTNAHVDWGKYADEQYFRNVFDEPSLEWREDGYSYYGRNDENLARFDYRHMPYRGEVEKVLSHSYTTDFTGNCVRSFLLASEDYYFFSSGVFFEYDAYWDQIVGRGSFHTSLQLSWIEGEKGRFSSTHSPSREALVSLNKTVIAALPYGKQLRDTIVSALVSLY